MINEPRIVNIHKDRSIPWFEQIRKTVVFQNESKPQVLYSIKPDTKIYIEL